MYRICVTGAGGFIGHHLVKRLKSEGHYVRGVDIKYPEYEPTAADEFELLDLRFFSNALRATRRCDQVYALAADMGGIGYITVHLADIARNNTLINTYTLEASRINDVHRYLYTSSACVYAHDKQVDENVTPLREEDAYPAMPEPGYGWEKLFAEQMCLYYQLDHGVDSRIVRFHNVYGPLGTYDGGKEKSPAALCRKISKLNEPYQEVEIWGDGKQTRSYMYIDDCIEGLVRLMASGYNQPLNMGTSELVSIDQLALLIASIANKPITLRHNLGAPQGVRGRNSENGRLRTVLGWEPITPLATGLVPTYRWIYQQVNGCTVAEEAERIEEVLSSD